MNKLRTLVDNILVPHSAFTLALQRLEQCFVYAEQGASEPVCVAVIGESRTGKSRSGEVFAGRHPRRRLDDGIQCPVLGLVVPSKPTVKSLAELILQRLGAPDWDRGTENAKTIRLVKLMRECQVLMLSLDEFHHFYDKTSNKVQHHVADWLKNLVGETRVALCVSGLPSLQAVIDQNEQLAGRFLSPIHMPRFDWMNEGHRNEFLGILGAFDDCLRAHFDLPELDSDEIAFRMYCATGGLMGYITKTLRQMVWNALDAETVNITLEDLRRAHEQAVWSKDVLRDLPNPFERSHPATPTSELLEQTRRIGTPMQAMPASHRTKAAAKRLGATGRVLVR